MLLHGCALGERSSGDIWKLRTSCFKWYVYHPHTTYSSGNIDVRNWVHLFESLCVFNHVLFFAITLRSVLWPPLGCLIIRINQNTNNSKQHKHIPFYCILTKIWYDILWLQGMLQRSQMWQTLVLSHSCRIICILIALLLKTPCLWSQGWLKYVIKHIYKGTFVGISYK